MLNILKTLACATLFGLAIAPTPAFAQERIEWQTDVAKAMEMAAQSNKLVLLHFSASWCRPCQHLETFVFTNYRVIRKFQDRVVPVKIDVDTNPEWVKKHGVSSIPTDVCLTPSGRVVVKQPSPKTADDYLRMFKRIETAANQIDEGNLALAQRIDEVIGTAQVDMNQLRQHPDFTPDGATHKHPGTPRTAQRMADDFVPTRTPIRQATATSTDGDESGATVTAGGLQQTDDSAKQDFQPPPRRIVNPKFTLPAIPQPTAKATTREPARSTAESNTSFVPPTEGSPPAPRKRIQVPTDIDSSMPTAPQPRSQATHSSANPIPQQLGKRMELILKADPVSATVEKPASGDFQQIEPKGTPSKMAMHGMCPVTLIEQGKWVKGNPEIGCVHRGRVYLFVDSSALDRFLTAPDDYSPLLAGYDPVIYHEEGRLVDGLESNGVFMGKKPNLRVILFQSAETQQKFKQEPRKYLQTIREATDRSDQTSSRTLTR